MTRSERFPLSALTIGLRRTPSMNLYLPIEARRPRRQPGRLLPRPHPAGPWTALLLLLLAALGPVTGSLQAQTSTNTFGPIVVLPQAGTAMATQSVVVVFLSIPTDNLTPFTNVTVTLQSGGPPAAMLDDGNAPDVAAADGTYSANLTVPAFPTSQNFDVRFKVVGQDLTVTNATGDFMTVTTNLTVTYQAKIRPANDNFADAIRVSAAGGVVTGNNQFASIEPAEPFHGGDPYVAASVWWEWSTPTNTSVLMDTVGSSFAPVLGVYSGLTLDTLEYVAWSTNDTVDGLKANVVFNAQAGATYHIAVAGYTPDTNNTGDLRLTIRPNGLPDTQPPVIAFTAPTNAVSTVLSSNLTVTGTALDPQPNGTGVVNVQVQVNDNPPTAANGTTSWSAAVSLNYGTNLIQAFAQDLAGNTSAPISLIVTYVDPPNDDFVNAIALTNAAGTVTCSTVRATKEPGEPNHADNEGGHSVWYRFATNVTPGTLTLTTQGSAFDTLLAVYTGDSVSNLTLVAANDDATPGSGFSTLTAELTNQTYYIAVDGFGGASGNVVLTYGYTSHVDFVTFNVQPTLGGVVSPPSGQYPAGTPLMVTALPNRDFFFAGWQGDVVSSNNPLAVVLDTSVNLTASFQFKGVSFTEDFESGRFGNNVVWATGGDAPWLIQTNVVAAGKFAARSGLVVDSQETWLTATADCLAGTGAFAVKVSSEAGRDLLSFYLNGQLLKQWSGDTGWQTYLFTLASGVNVLKWQYVKDANFSAGLDAGFVDSLFLPLVTSPVTPQITLLTVPGPTNQVQIQVFGQPNRAYVVQTTPDFARWTPVLTNATTNGSFFWFDPSVATTPQLFYRAVAP
jgi:hypothetical protein